ncbi:hypothetical protein G7048_15715 [Diaphorobacter sp. HDW4B]|uniref:hypothetical protein n=1 Tax=Diaphorobacter sp. HDW4B TaxID=2714925 RepID=UPI00140952BB|nr:hypothetical protein [Diaphorobacter sp. HDW4B]QIL71675.1 hypothetical protein G7048_15715 [Diaphorobacter sp. HDW4B]
MNISAGTRIGGVKNSGDALTTGIAVEINNLGTISGGGGKGGWGETTYVDRAGVSDRMYGTGGGGGDGQGFNDASSLSVVPATGGGAGTYVKQSGPVVGGTTAPSAQGGNGGGGGAWGVAGSAGQAGSVGGDYYAAGVSQAAISGTAPGNAVNGNSKVTWIAMGTRLGGLIN